MSVGSSPSVGVVIVNYGVDPTQLQKTIRSVVLGEADSPVATVHEIVVVDNASPRWRDEARKMVEAEQAEHGTRTLRIRWHQSQRNTGFAGGVNTGVSVLEEASSFVFLLNPDARVSPNTIARLVDALCTAPPEVLSVAPKMLLDVDPKAFDETRPILDSVGNAINAKGEGLNIGLGQPDFGQFDMPRSVFGPCFGAALFRRHAFNSDVVGPLNEKLFLYYEDVEWNWRAQNLGYGSQSVPAATVLHHMSITMRDRPYDEKFRLTERNLLLCALTHFETRTALRVVVRRILGLLKGSILGRHYPVAGIRAVLGFLVGMPPALRVRRRLRYRRVRADAEVTKFGIGQEIFYDPVRYVPARREAAYAAATQALNVGQGGSESGAIQEG